MKKSNKFIIPLVAFLSSLVTAIITAIITLLITFIILAFIALTVTLSITLSDPCMKGHAWDEGVVVAPTCTEEGYTVYTCTNKKCYATENIDVVAALGHTFDEGTVTTEPTCGADGVKTYACTVENCEGTKIEAIAATGEHTYIDATCEVPKTCSVCQATDGEALGHTFVATENYVVVEGVAYVVEACACGATQNGGAQNYVVVSDAATLVIESGKTYILGETAMGTITLTGELTNVTFIGGEFAAIVVGDATIDGLTIKDASFATEAGIYFFNKDNAAVVKNVVFDGCKFDGTNLTNNAVNVNVDNGIENITVTNCEFANMGAESICVFINFAGNAGIVNITNNTADNFDNRFVRMAQVTEGTVTISGNTLTNWVNTYNDADIIKATDTTATYVVENNTLDGEAIPAEKINVPVVEEEEPETPVDPEEPTEPETPVDPEEPTEPETPVDPEEPTEPETPVDPEDPTEPETPVDPEDPTEGGEDEGNDGADAE